MLVLKVGVSSGWVLRSVGVGGVIYTYVATITRVNLPFYYVAECQAIILSFQCNIVLVKFSQRYGYREYARKEGVNSIVQFIKILA